MIGRTLLWVAMVGAAAAAVIVLNLALLGSATSGREPVGKQSARTRLLHLRPSPGVRQRPHRAPGLEADD